MFEVPLHLIAQLVCASNQGNSLIWILSAIVLGDDVLYHRLALARGDLRNRESFG
jgi:hypothetical protein